MFLKGFGKDDRCLMGTFVTQVDESIAIIGHKLDTRDNQPHKVLFQRLVERRDGCGKSVRIEAVVVKYPLQFLCRFIFTALIDVRVHFVQVFIRMPGERLMVDVNFILLAWLVMSVR